MPVLLPTPAPPGQKSSTILYGTAVVTVWEIAAQVLMLERTTWGGENFSLVMEEEPTSTRAPPTAAAAQPSTIIGCIIVGRGFMWTRIKTIISSMGMCATATMSAYSAICSPT